MRVIFLIFISETASIRNGDWKIRGIPADLQDRRVEITGPVERKMVINALNANVKVFMADFEDSLAPDWHKVIDGQINLRDAVNGTISYTNEAGKNLSVAARSGGSGLPRSRPASAGKKHVTRRGEAIPGSLFDFCALFLPQLPGPAGERERPLFLSAENPVPARGGMVGAKSSVSPKIVLNCRAAPLRLLC